MIGLYAEAAELFYAVIGIEINFDPVIPLLLGKGILEYSKGYKEENEFGMFHDEGYVPKVIFSLRQKTQIFYINLPNLSIF